MSFKEMCTMLQRLDPNFGNNKVRALFDHIDHDLSGAVEADEFVDFVMGDKVLSRLFLMEDKPSEEEAKCTLLGKPLELREAAFKESKKRGLKWGTMTWQE